MQIVDQPTRAGQRRRWRRRLQRAAGSLMWWAGLAVLGPSLLVLLALIAVTIHDGSLGGIDETALSAPAALVGAGLMWAGSRALKKGRGLVLFLRRFGFDDAAHAVTQAVARENGHHWRVLTLDDDRVAPLGVPRRIHLGLAAVVVLGFAIVVVGVLFVQSVSADLRSDPRGAGDPLEAFALIITQAIFAIYASMALVLIVILPLTVLATLAGGSTLLLYQIRRSETRRRLHVDDVAQIDEVTRRAALDARRFASGRFLVARVVPAIWQPTVTALARRADVVLVDVSRPSEALVWEVRMLHATGHRHCIYIGERDSVLALQEAACLQGAAADLRQLLDPRPVRVYGRSAADRERFARILGERLAECGR